VRPLSTLGPAADIVLGGFATCAVGLDGQIWCIGGNNSCGLGYLEPWYFMEFQRVLDPVAQ
jgi:hypothetical protein